MSEMTNVQKLSPGPRLQLAAVLAPAFVQRYDFSDPKNYDSIADQAFKLAGIMIERIEALTAEAQAKDQVIADKLASEVEKQRLKDEAAKRLQKEEADKVIYAPIVEAKEDAK
jgi:hypothetical protein